MPNNTKKTQKTDLERSALEMVKAARQLTNIKREDPFWAGVCKETLKRLTRLEKQIHKHRKKSSSEAKVQEIAKELAQLVGNLCKSLIRCKYHFRMQCFYFAF